MSTEKDDAARASKIPEAPSVSGMFDTPRTSRSSGITPRISQNTAATIFNGTHFDNTYRVKVLPEFQAPAVQNTNQDDKTAASSTLKPIELELSDFNAGDYADMIKENHVGWRGRIDYSLRELYEGKAVAVDNPIDQNSLLQLVISSIVMVAKGLDLPKDHVICTEVYLDNIRNEFGDHPKNIANFLQHLRAVKETKGITFKVDECNQFDDDIPRGLILTKFPKCTMMPPDQKRCSSRSSRKSK